MATATKEDIQEIKDVLEEVKSLIQEYLEKSSKKSTGKKGASTYNRFVGDCMKEGHSMKECASFWNEMKEKDQYEADDITFEEAKKQAENEA